MPRQPRLDKSGTLHHVRGREIERGAVRGSVGSVVRAQGIFCQVAARRLGYTGTSVAQFLGVMTSLVNRYASSEGVGNLNQYL